MIIENLPEAKGKARFHVYEGDIEYREVSTIPSDGPYYIRQGKLYVPAQPKVEDSGWTDNLVVTTGKTLLLQLLYGLGGPPNSMNSANGNLGVGTDSAAAAVGQTKLNPVTAGSVQLQVNDATFPSISSLTVTSQATFATGTANFQWNECGLFNGPTNGTSTMFDRIAPIGPFTKTASVSIVLIIQVTQS